jgi:hypothetical protein
VWSARRKPDPRYRLPPRRTAPRVIGWWILRCLTDEVYRSAAVIAVLLLTQVTINDVYRRLGGLFAHR